MTRTLIAAFATLALTTTPALGATRTADAARAASARLSPISQPIRATLRTAGTRKPRYDLPQMMARNFGTIGQHQLDVLVASVQ